MQNLLKKQEVALLCYALDSKGVPFYSTSFSTQHRGGPVILLPGGQIAVWMQRENLRDCAPLSPAQCREQDRLYQWGWKILMPNGHLDALKQLGVAV